MLEAGLSALLLALAGTGLMRRYALARRLLDVPNARSSHTQSTPRGGGAAIVLGFVVAVLTWLPAGGWQPGLVVAVLPAVLAVAAVGFWDDHRHLPARLRLLVHFVAVAWSMHWLGGDLALPWPSGVSLSTWPVQLLALLGLVWLLNLFNFMDGIDGIAASEAAFVAIGGAVLASWSGQGAVALAFAALAGAALGFLPWNWPPAKIFMGDVGSGFLGAALGILGYAAALDDPATVWAWPILLGVFVVDATLTLGRRLLRRERVHQAHRSHAYQWAARRWGHRRVTLVVAAINLGWLLPLAWLAFLAPDQGVFLLAIAYLPLIPLALAIGAGRRENNA